MKSIACLFVCLVFCFYHLESAACVCVDNMTFNLSITSFVPTCQVVINKYAVCACRSQRDSGMKRKAREGRKNAHTVAACTASLTQRQSSDMGSEQKEDLLHETRDTETNLPQRGRTDKQGQKLGNLHSIWHTGDEYYTKDTT